MANTWHAPFMPLLTQPERKPLWRVMTSKRTHAFWWLAYRHGVRWSLARLVDAFLRLRLTACAACIPTHELTPQGLPLRSESHRSVHIRIREGPDVWQTSIAVINSNHTFEGEDVLQRGLRPPSSGGTGKGEDPCMRE
jgi:hypothetical protein